MIFRRPGKETEVNSAIFSLFGQVGFLQALQMGGVLENQPSVIFEQALVEDDSRNFFYAFHLVGGVGKYQVIGAGGFAQELKYILFNYFQVIDFQVIHHFAYKPYVVEYFFNGCHLSASSGNKFKADVPGTGKKIEGIGTLKIEPVFQDVK